MLRELVLTRNNSDYWPLTTTTQLDNNIVTMTNKRSASDYSDPELLKGSEIITGSLRNRSASEAKATQDGVIVEDPVTGDVRKLSADFVLDPAAERKLVWKFDIRILPTLAVMYLCNALDKGNLGNAKTAGLEKTLKLHGSQYNLILSIFFIPYVLTAPFLAMLGKKYGPSRVLPCMMMCFGFMTLMTVNTILPQGNKLELTSRQVAAFNFSGLMALRWFLGMAESAFFPLVIYYQTTFVHPLRNILLC